MLSQAMVLCLAMYHGIDKLQCWPKGKSVRLPARVRSNKDQDLCCAAHVIEIES